MTPRGLRAALLGSALAIAAPGHGEDFGPCRALAQQHPFEEHGPQCVFRMAEERGTHGEAAEELRLWAGGPRDSGWVRLFLARTLSRHDSSRVQPEFERAVELFRAERQFPEELRALSFYITWLAAEQRLDELPSRLERARTLLSVSRDPLDRLRIGIAEVHYRLVRGGNLEEAYTRLQGAWEQIRPGPGPAAAGLGVPFDLQTRCLWSLGQIAWTLGLYGEAREHFRKRHELARANRRFVDQVTARYDLVTVRLDHELPDKVSRRQISREVRRLLALARQVGPPEVEAHASRLMAQLEGWSTAGADLERCRELAEEIGFPEVRRSCYLALASHVAAADPARARRLLKKAHETAFEADSPWTPVYDWRDQLQVLWEIDPREGLQAGEAVVLAIEGLSRAQSGLARERLLSTWAGAYYWVSGKLLQPVAQDPEGGTPGGGTPEGGTPEGGTPEGGTPGGVVTGGGRADLRRAVTVMERLRARRLREILELGRPPETLLPAPLEAERRDLRERLRAVYREMLDPDLTDAARRRLLARLERLEREEAALRDRLRRSAAAAEPLEPVAGDLLDRVEAALAGDEALLSFQLAPWEGFDRRFAGGSWLTVTTREGSRVYPLPELADLVRQAGIFLHATEPGDDSSRLGRWLASFLGREPRPAASGWLYEKLLEEFLGDLPGSVERLILVPDGILHRLPFAALRPSPAAPPLGERFALSLVPSAGLWLRWQTEEARRPAGPALILAAPPSPGAARAGGATTRDRGRSAGFGPLPWARCEGRCVRRHFGGRLVTGSAASKRFLESADLAPFQLVHVAAHAIVDDRRPWRSGILLAGEGGAPVELLRYEDIGGLELDGKAVVLSTCESAVGEVLRGEGAMSLARAFFEAGARAVVATLRRLPDREGARFFGAFYRELDGGKSLAEALSATQRRWIDRGRPPDVWAHVVVLGDGDLVPVPAGSQGRRWPCSLDPSCWPERLPLRLALAVALILAARRLLRTSAVRSSRPKIS